MRYIAGVFVFILSNVAFAVDAGVLRPPPVEDAWITGRVQSKGTRRPILGAAVWVDGKPYEVDAHGHFELPVSAGTVVLDIQAPGFKRAAHQETLQVAQRLEVVYALEPLSIRPYETVVRAERERTEVSRITLHEQELREVPGTMGDPFRVVMLMPGVGSMASGVSYPVVRGTQPAATGYFLDGVRVPALFHALLGPAVVHPDFIDSIDFYPGAPPPQYGRLMGGVIEGHVSRPREDRLHATVYADLINAGGFVEYPFPTTGTTVTAAGRFSYAPWLLSLLAPIPQDGPKRSAVAEFYDYQARVDQRLGQGRLRLLAFGSSDVLGTRSDSPFDLSGSALSTFHRVDLRYRHGGAEVGITYGQEQVGVSGNRAGVRVGEYTLSQHNVSARGSWAWDVGDALKLTLGGDVEHKRSATVILGAEVPSGSGAGEGVAFREPLTLGTFAGVYAQAVWRPHGRWSVIPGVRLDHYHLAPRTNHLAFEPRLAIRYAVTDSLTLKGGAGLFHQAPTVLITLPVMDVAGLRHGLQEGAQFDLGAEWKANTRLELSVDFFFNPLFRAVEFDLGRVLQDRQRAQVAATVGAPGRSYGMELMVRHPLGGNWFGWLSYALMRSERSQRFSRFDESLAVAEVVSRDVPFAFDQTHVFNAALSYKFANNFTVGAVLHFNSGRPESGEITSRSQRAATDPMSGEAMWSPQDRDQVDRLPSFFRLDVRVSKTWAFNQFVLDVYLDMLNATLNQEVLGYSYYLDQSRPDPRVKNPIGIPVVIPVLGIKGTY